MSNSETDGRVRATSSDVSDAGVFHVAKFPLRVCTSPPYRREVKTLQDTPQCRLVAEELGNGVLEQDTKNILPDEGMGNVISVELVERAVLSLDPFDGFPTAADGQPTILIVAPWEKGCSTLWEKVVRRVKKLVDSKKLASQARELSNLNIAVEMIDEQLTLKKYLSLVSNKILEQGMEEDWPRIEDKVQQGFGELPEHERPHYLDWVV